MRTTIVRLVAIAMLALLLAACGTAQGQAPVATSTPPATPLPEPGEGSAPGVTIRGNLSDVRAAAQGDTLGFIRVEGEKIAGNQYGRAELRITGATQVFEKQGQRLVQVDFGALEFGETVEATMIGPIMESWPVQAAASQVIILARMPKN